MVDELIIEDDVIKGVRTNIQSEYYAEAVIVTQVHFYVRNHFRKHEIFKCPNHQLPSVTLADNLRGLGFDARRFKTGTPPRVTKTIDYDKTEINPVMTLAERSVSKLQNIF